jgi:DNA-binding GntR family transcriptional regulator
MRRALEREAVRLVAERWTTAHGRRLEGIVKEEEQARRAGDGKASIRLAGDFHLALAEMADNFLLERYLGETVSRCSVILALHARPHSEDCAISEHRHIIETLRSGTPKAAMEAMDRHIDAIVQRASLDAEPAAPPALADVLSRYSAEVDGAPATRPAARRKPAKAPGATRRR